MPAFILCYINTLKKGVFCMVKTLVKMAEKAAKSNNAACWSLGVLHQPKMPAALIKKD